MSTRLAPAWDIRGWNADQAVDSTATEERHQFVAIGQDVSQNCSVWVSVSSFCQLNPRDDFNIPLAVQSLELSRGEGTFQTKRNYHSNTSSIAATFQASTDLQTMGARLAKTWYGAPDPGWPLRARAHFRRKYREGVERRRSDYRPAMAQ